MSDEQASLRAAIEALQDQREVLGEAVVRAALAGLRAQLELLQTQPESAAAAQPTLRQVTILFVDAVGSTELSGRLDPEDTQAVMSQLLQVASEVVAGHGGMVLEYAGDSVLAVFGAHSVSEDDAERAIRAGLALLDQGRRLADRVQQQHGHASFNVRVGIHTGPVLLGGGMSPQGGIHGAAVNYAARMEQSAPAGTLRISHHTYRHVRGIFDVLPQPPMHVKGVAEPVVSYLVLRAKPRAFRVATRGIEGLETAMIGRDQELDRLRAAFAQVCRDRRLCAVLVVGEAGLGKSRLLYEFQNWAETQAQVYVTFLGRATPQSQGRPYGLLRDVLAWRFEIGDGDSMAEACRKLEEGVVPLFVDSDGAELARAHAHLLGQLIGLDFAASPHLRGILDDARQIRSRAFHAAAQLFLRLAARHDAPVVLQLEDLHWADDGSLDFLLHLAQVGCEAPLLLLALARPALFERRPTWAEELPGRTAIELRALGDVASASLADELLKKLPAAPAMLCELIRERGAGNPFYMEELVKMLVDQGAITTGLHHWSLQPEKLSPDTIPGTLAGVLQARLDGLPANERLALQEASVVGMVFWAEALAALDSQASLALPALVRRQLTLPSLETALEGTREFWFSHHILHRVTYDTLLKHTRRDLHARAGAWLAQTTGERSKDFLAVIADHFEKAGDATSASDWYIRAAEHAATRYAHASALEHARQALALLPASGGSGQHWRALAVCEDALGLLGRREEQRGVLAQMQQWADEADDDARRAQVAYRRATLAIRVGDHKEQEGAARLAIALATRAGDQKTRIAARQSLAAALAYLADPSAQALACEGLAEARACGSRRAESGYLNILAGVATQQGRLQEGRELVQQSLEIVRELKDLQWESIGCVNLGSAAVELGDFEQAQTQLQLALQLLRATGNLAVQPFAMATLSRLALCRGEADQALDWAQQAVDLAAAVQARSWHAFALCSLGSARLALGQHSAAMAAFEAARAMGEQIGQVNFQLDAMAGLARVALDENDVPRARDAVQPLLEHLEGGKSLEGTRSHALLRMTCVQVLQRCGDPRAESLLAAAHSELQKVAMTFPEGSARQALLCNLPENRAIVAAMAAQRTMPSQARD